MRGDLDQFVMDAGLVQGDGELSEPAKEALYKHALGFLQCGGVLSYQEWLGMRPSTVEAFREAKETVEAEKIAVLCAMFGVPRPKERKNPSAPENREAWENTEEEEDQAVVSAMMDQILERKLAG